MRRQRVGVATAVAVKMAANTVATEGREAMAAMAVAQGLTHLCLAPPKGVGRLW